MTLSIAVACIVLWILTGLYATAITNRYERKEFSVLYTNHPENCMHLIALLPVFIIGGPISFVVVSISTWSLRGSLSCKPIGPQMAGPTRPKKPFRAISKEGANGASCGLIDDRDRSRLEIALADTKDGRECLVLAADAKGIKTTVYRGPWPITNKDLIDQFAQHAARSLNAA